MSLLETVAEGISESIHSLGGVGQGVAKVLGAFLNEFVGVFLPGAKLPLWTSQLLIILSLALLIKAYGHALSRGLTIVIYFLLIATALSLGKYLMGV